LGGFKAGFYYENMSLLGHDAVSVDSYRRFEGACCFHIQGLS